MVYRRALAAAGVLLWSGTAEAADVRLSLGAYGEWDSNIFHREPNDDAPGGVESDFVIVALPQIQLLETEGKLTYEAGYQFPYQRSIQTNALRDFNHIANVGVDYHLSDRTQLAFSDRFSYVESLSNNFNATPTISDNQEKQQVLRNRSSSSLVHRFTPRLSSNNDLSVELYHTTQKNRSNNRSYSLTSGLDYMLTERQSAGGGMQLSYLDFDESNDSPKSHSVFVGPFVSWSYRIDDKSHLELSGGPSWISEHRDEFTGPPVQLSSTEMRWAGFGVVSLDRRWSPTMTSGASYQRRQDTASGVAGAAILDAVALTHTWQLADTWTLALRADWTKRKSATQASSTSEELDTQRWGAGSSLSKRITRNLTGSLRYQYSKQSSLSSSAGSFSDYDDHVVTWGLDYSFDPIEVW